MTTRTRLDLGLLLALTAVLAAGAARPAYAQDAALQAELEIGAVAASRNDVRIPGAGGTDLSLVDDLESPVAPVFRVRVGARFAERHVVTALFAPLRLNATGVLDRRVEFAGATFPAGSSVHALFRFDSYRLTYRYSFLRDEAFELAAGVTGKIRAAEISLYGAEAGRKPNVGFVPLINVHLEWYPGGGELGLLVDADALVAPQGRAEDVLLAFSWTLREGLALHAGYRTLEGGADNDEVYNFTWLHYAVIGLRVDLLASPRG
jgi:hypothetical protein